MSVTKISLKEFLDLYPEDGSRGPRSSTHTHSGNRFLTFEGTSAQFCTACALGQQPDPRDPAGPEEMASNVLARRRPTRPAPPVRLNPADHIFCPPYSACYGASRPVADRCGFPGCDGPWTEYGTLRGVRTPSCDEHASETPLELS